ncbi:MAG: hypothetical protein QM485_13230 [Flavobacteriaceae bacterium]
MKNHRFLLLLLLVSSFTFAQWKSARKKIKTTWALTLNPDQVLAEYPRPLMKRSKWKNLNGLWQYSI